jgi:YbgC/YbaW family acyl-CoA thioester hydrolase
VSPVSRTEVEARSYELDPYGHLNNAVFVSWLEHGRSVYLRERGMSWQSLPEEFGVRVVVVHQSISYKTEVRQDDRLIVESRIRRWGRTSFPFAQRIVFEDGRLAAEGEVVMVCIDGEGRAVPVPEGLRERLAS